MMKKAAALVKQNEPLLLKTFSVKKPSGHQVLVRIHASGNGNVFFVATPAKELKQHRTMDFAAMHVTVRQQARDAMDGIKETNPQSGIVLTDDFNPVEFHDAKNREQFRGQLAFSMRPRWRGGDPPVPFDNLPTTRP